MSKHPFWASFFGNLAGSTVKAVAKATIAASNQPALGRAEHLPQHLLRVEVEGV
jgi:hypothetical protein